VTTPALQGVRRDPFGEARLYYACASQDRRLVTAGSIPELACLAGLVPRIDRVAAARALCGSLGPGETLFAGVHRVPPGHELLEGRGTAPWWEPPLPRGRPTAADGEVGGPDAGRAADLLRLLHQAVRRRLAASEAAACTLSGGIDSGGLLALVSRERLSVRAWTLVDDAAGEDETDRARRLAARSAVEHVEVRVREEDLPDHAAETLAACDEPLWNGRAVSMRLFFREVGRAGDRAVLTGTGADEVLCGNPEGLQSSADRAVDERALARALLTPEAAAWIASPRPDPPRPEGVDPIVWLQHVALHTTLPDSTLPPESCGAAASGVRVLRPYLDTELATFALGLPARQRARGGVGKVLLREALRDLVPEDVRTAAKAPRLAAPGGRSSRARRRWSDFYQAWLTRNRMNELGVVDPGRVAALLEAFARAGDDDPRRPAQDAVLMRLASLAVLSHRSALPAAAHVEAPAGGTAG
jgi:asparagine synthase (glutamine-hydrolysing)